MAEGKIRNCANGGGRHGLHEFSSVRLFMAGYLELGRPSGLYQLQPHQSAFTPLYQDFDGTGRSRWRRKQGAVYAWRAGGHCIASLQRWKGAGPGGLLRRSSKAASPWRRRKKRAGFSTRRTPRSWYGLFDIYQRHNRSSEASNCQLGQMFDWRYLHGSVPPETKR